MFSFVSMTFHPPLCILICSGRQAKYATRCVKEREKREIKLTWKIDIRPDAWMKLARFSCFFRRAHRSSPVASSIFILFSYHCCHLNTVFRWLHVELLMPRRLRILLFFSNENCVKSGTWMYVSIFRSCGKLFAIDGVHVHSGESSIRRKKRRFFGISLPYARCCLLILTIEQFFIFIDISIQFSNQFISGMETMDCTRLSFR